MELTVLPPCQCVFPINLDTEILWAAIGGYHKGCCRRLYDNSYVNSSGLTVFLFPMNAEGVVFALCLALDDLRFYYHLNQQLPNSWWLHSTKRLPLIRKTSISDQHWCCSTGTSYATSHGEFVRAAGDPFRIRKHLSPFSWVNPNRSTWRYWGRSQLWFMQVDQTQEWGLDTGFGWNIVLK